MSNLNPQQFDLYHVAPQRVRQSIKQHGLNAEHAPYERSTSSTGFYAFTDLDEAKWYRGVMANDRDAPEPFDIWHGRSSQSVEPDHGLSSGSEAETSAVWHPSALPARRVRRLT